MRAIDSSVLLYYKKDTKKRVQIFCVMTSCLFLAAEMNEAESGKVT